MGRSPNATRNAEEAPRRRGPPRLPRLSYGSEFDNMGRAARGRGCSIQTIQDRPGVVRRITEIPISPETAPAMASSVASTQKAVRKMLENFNGFMTQLPQPTADILKTALMAKPTSVTYTEETQKHGLTDDEGWQTVGPRRRDNTPTRGWGYSQADRARTSQRSYGECGNFETGRGSSHGSSQQRDGGRTY